MRALDVATLLIILRFLGLRSSVFAPFGGAQFALADRQLYFSWSTLHPNLVITFDRRVLEHLFGFFAMSPSEQYNQIAVCCRRLNIYWRGPERAIVNHMMRRRPTARADNPPPEQPVVIQDHYTGEWYLRWHNQWWQKWVGHDR